jgi:hypothetical protein
VGNRNAGEVFGYADAEGCVMLALYAAAILACDPVTYYGLPLILPCGPAVYVCAEPQGVAYLGDRSWVVGAGCSDDRIAIRSFEP